MRTSSKPLRRCLHAIAFWIVAMALLILISAGTRALPWVWQAIVNGGIAATAAYALSFWFCRRDALAAEGARLVPDRNSPGRFALGLVAGALLAAAFALSIWWLGIVEYRPAAVPPPATLAWLALGFVLLALREEIVFRGYLLRTLEIGLGRWPALAFMAMLFTIEHLLGGYSILNALIGSVLSALVFGMAAIASRSLAFPLGLHAAWNMVDWATGGKGSAGLLERIGDGSEGTQAAALAVYAATMSIALLVLWHASRRHARLPSSRS